MSHPFTHLLRVRYGECDAQNVVFNARYADYVDIAATEFIRHVWGDYSDILAQGLDSQVVSLKIDWQAPAQFDDVLAITVKTQRVGNTSYSVELVFTKHGEDKVLVTSEVVYVMLDSKSYQKASIPDDLRQRLERGAPGVVANHAGAVL